MIVVRGSCTHELSAKVVAETAILSVAVWSALYLSVIYEAELRSTGVIACLLPRAFRLISGEPTATALCADHLRSRRLTRTFSFQFDTRRPLRFAEICSIRFSRNACLKDRDNP